MKLVIKNLLVILLITNLSSMVLTKESSSNISNSEEKSVKKSSAASEKNKQVLINTVRTHHYEEAEEAPPGSIASRVIPNPSFAVRSPVAAAVPSMVNIAGPSPMPRLVTANEWKIPFPVVRPGQPTPIPVNRPVLGPPPGAFGIHRAPPVNMVNIGGVPPTPVAILKPPVNMINIGGVPPTPVGILRPGVTRVMQFPVTGSSFNTNYEGNIDTIDDLKISNAFDSILQGDIDHGVDLLVDFLSHSLPNEHEKILFKISQRIQLSGLNINQNLLFERLSQKLTDKDNLLQKIKGLVEENKKELPKSLNATDNILLNGQPQINQNQKSSQANTKKAAASGSHLSVSLNKHQALNKKEIINRKASMSNLLQWAKSNKIQLKKIHINFANSGYGISKSEDKIKSGETILTVPKDFILTSSNPELKSGCEAIKKIEELKDEAELICLSVGLKNKLAENPKFKEYISYLFETVKYSNFPLLYSAAENQLIKGSYLNSLINARKSVYKLQYSILKKKKIFTKENFSEEEYFKSRIIVNSKFVNLNINGKKTSALIPLADLFSSKLEKSNCELVQLKNGSVQLKSSETINKKDAIRVSIGKYSNYHFLINYGFSVINNSTPLEVYLDLKIKNDNGEKKNKEILLKKDYDINNSLIKLRKIVNKLANEKNSKIKNFDTPKSVENELESLRVFKNGLKSQISNYATNIKDDIIKSTKAKNYNEVNILNVLIEEKKIVIKYYNAAVIFSKMLKQANENKDKKLILTAKLTNMIIKKSYLKQYFTILQDNLKLNVELNNGTSKEGLNIEDEELLHDLNDSEDDNLFSNSGENAASGLSAHNDDYEVQASNNFAKSLAGLGNKESEDEDGLDVNTDDDSFDGKFLN